MSELLFEILSEEIPSSLQEKASKELSETFINSAKDHGITFSKFESFFSCRRLSFVVEGIPPHLDNIKIEKKGPKTTVKEEIIEAFLKSNNVSKADLEIREIKNQEYYFINKTQSPPKITEILSQIIVKSLNSINWPKSMRWGESEARWIRPIKNLLCIFDERILQFNFHGIKTNNLTFGHRFMKNEPCGVLSFEEYCKFMKNSFVIFNQNERINMIKNQIEVICSEKGLKFIEDKALLNEVCGLVEFPNVLVGEIDEKFLSLPRELLINSLRDHQKYFILEKADGNLSKYFIIVSNVKTNEDSIIILGNEKVLKARLSDAEFFIEQDQKTKLIDKLENLKHVSFHESLGSMYEKTQRIIEISEILSNEIPNSNLDIVKQASLLCKADLTSEIISEFPKLQGIMGSYYAKFDGESDDVSLAIYDHYKPISANLDFHNLPKTLDAAIIALSDKLDNITGMFASNNAPTSSKDPFALRRHALGVIRILINHKISIDLPKIIKKCLDLYGKGHDSFNDILDFFNERFKFHLKKDFSENNLINIVTNLPLQNIYISYIKLCSLKSFVASSEISEFVSLFKRANNLVSTEISQFGEFSELLLKEDAEKKLYENLKIIEEKIIHLFESTNDFTSNVFDEYFRILLEFKQPLAMFFDEVMVMTEDQNISKNRQILLAKIKAQFEQIGNFSLIEVN